MHRYIFSFATLPASLLLLCNTVLAQTHPSIRLSPSQMQRISNDLVRSSSRDFFERGQKQLENEIETLNRRQQFLNEGVLKISRDLQIQQDTYPFERLDNLPRSR